MNDPFNVNNSLDNNLKERGENNNIIYAGFWRRLGAFFIDYWVLIVIQMIVESVYFLIDRQAKNTYLNMQMSQDMTHLSKPYLILCLMSMFVSGLYFGILQSSNWQTSIGGRFLKTRVLKYDLTTIHFWTAFFRSIFLSLLVLIPSLLKLPPTISHIYIKLYSLLLIASVIIFFVDKQRRFLHDIIFRTIVVCDKKIQDMLATKPVENDNSIAKESAAEGTITTETIPPTADTTIPSEKEVEKDRI